MFFERNNKPQKLACGVQAALSETANILYELIKYLINLKLKCSFLRNDNSIIFFRQLVFSRIFKSV